MVDALQPNLKTMVDYLSTRYDDISYDIYIMYVGDSVLFWDDISYDIYIMYVGSLPGEQVSMTVQCHVNGVTRCLRQRLVL